MNVISDRDQEKRQDEDDVNPCHHNVFRISASINIVLNGQLIGEQPLIVDATYRLTCERANNQGGDSDAR